MQAIQAEFFDPTIEQRFDSWKERPGARHVLRDIYRMAAGYVPGWRRDGIPVSIKLLWELERHRIKRVRTRAQRLGVRLGRDHGYTLNNDFTAMVARHIEQHRPDWRGLFEKRERNQPHSTGTKKGIFIPLNQHYQRRAAS
jgi:hypothetical protein